MTGAPRPWRAGSSTVARTAHGESGATEVPAPVGPDAWARYAVGSGLNADVAGSATLEEPGAVGTQQLEAGERRVGEHLVVRAVGEQERHRLVDVTRLEPHVRVPLVEQLGLP